MRKFVALCALVLTACAPTAVASTSLTTGEANRAIPAPATYYPTSTPFPTWTPLPSPTSLPTATASVAPPPAETPIPPPTSEPIPPPALPAPSATPALVALATLAPTETAIPPLPTPIPLALAPTPEPRMAAFAAPASCSTGSATTYDLVSFDGPAYKNNALTDENADLRLSVLGYTFSDAPLSLADYNGATDPDAPKLHGLFEPNRVPAFVASHQHYGWAWNENSGPPYGSSSGVNGEWPASVMDLGASSGEAIHIPERGPVIWGNGVIAMVLYAGERELTLAYTRQDSVTVGYVVHMLNFCVDANLIAQYRAQLSDGRRATGQLPGVRNNQVVGVALGPITIAIRDRGAFLDPRSRKDWW